MNYKIILLFCAIASSSTILGQDYFEDIRSNGLPVLVNTNTTQKMLFSSVLNTADNSFKLNLFRQRKSSDYGWERPGKLPRGKTYKGWGLNVKAKTENGLGSVFGSGELNPGLSAGGYLSLLNQKWVAKGTDTKFAEDLLLFSASYTSTQFQLYDSTTIYSKQLSDTVFKSWSIGLSYTHFFYGEKNNVYLSFSGLLSRMNNYSKLDKAEIKDINNVVPVPGRVRSIQTVNDDGYTYAMGSYKEYTNFRLRANLTIDPDYFDHNIAFIIYPSVDYSKEFYPKYNIGFSIARLKEKSPGVTTGAVFFEFNDIQNAAASQKPFLKRSFKIGVSIALNIFTGK